MRCNSCKRLDARLARAEGSRVDRFQRGPDFKPGDRFFHYKGGFYPGDPQEWPLGWYEWTGTHYKRVEQ
jgi:hypothetical protein